MKQIKFSEFKKLTASEIKQSPCLEVVADGQHIAFLIVGSEGDMRVRIQAIASQIDAGRGK